MAGFGSRRTWKKQDTACTLLFLSMFILTSGSEPLEKQSCRLGDYLTQSGICCTKCSPGFKLEKDCSSHNERTMCAPCPRGQYTDQQNFTPNCRRCKDCGEHEEEVSTCDGKRNRVCRCKPGFYKDVIDSATYQCFQCKTCRSGERQTEKCSSDHNTVCECEHDYYRVKKKCLPCRNCTDSCKHHCPSQVTRPRDVENHIPKIALIGTGVLVMLLMTVAFVTYKATKVYTKLKLASSSPQPEASEETTKIVICNEESCYHDCNAVPQSTASGKGQPSLPDCIPLEIKISDLIYTVLDLVPVPRIKQLVRSLGVTDIEIERAEVDYHTCKEAHYQMLRVWAEGVRGSRGGVLHWPLMQQLLDKLKDMYLEEAIDKLKTKYGIV